ncbi:hypothetical protein BGW42_000606 [Actinomortierella wolfii]|nr:hypothetical protein BGW42_000606 [Actinomortierella wolfii]
MAEMHAIRNVVSIQPVDVLPTPAIAAPVPFHGLPTELVQHIASFLPFEDLVRLYKSFPVQYRDILQSMIDQVFALMVLQLEIHQERSSIDESATLGPGIGGLANRLIHRFLSLVNVEPSNLLSFGVEDEDEAPPLVPMANPDPNLPPAQAQPAPGGARRAAATPIANDATLSTSWRVVEFDKETLRLTFELEEKLELERTVRQQQPFMFGSKEDEDEEAEKAGSVRASRNTDQKGVHVKRSGGNEVVEKENRSVLEPRGMNKKPTPESHQQAALSVRSTSPGTAKEQLTPPAHATKANVVSSPFPGLSQTLLDSHLRENSYFHCISTTQPATLRSAKVSFRGSRSMAAPWIVLPSMDTTSLWSRPRSHWSLSDVESALAQQRHYEEHILAGGSCNCRYDWLSSPLVGSSRRLSKRAQERMATFHQNRVLARFLLKSHSLATRCYSRDGSVLFSGKEYLSTKIPLEVSELCTCKSVQAIVVSAADGTPTKKELQCDDQPTKEALSRNALNSTSTSGSSESMMNGQLRRRKRDIIREGWRRLFESSSILSSFGADEASPTTAICPVISSLLGTEYGPDTNEATEDNTTQLAIRTVRYNCGELRSKMNSPDEVPLTGRSCSTSPNHNALENLLASRQPWAPESGEPAASPSSSSPSSSSSSSAWVLSSMTKRFFGSASYFSNRAPSSNYRGRSLKRLARALVHLYTMGGSDTVDDDDDDEEEEVIGTWDEGNSDHHKGKEWLREKDEGEQVTQEKRTEEDEEGEEQEQEQEPLFEFMYGVGHNYMNAVRLEGERVIRPIRFSCSLDFFLSA